MTHKKINQQILARLERLEKAIFDSGDRSMNINKNKFESGIKKLINKTKISEGKIKEIFDFEGDVLTVVQIMGSNPKEKIQNVSLLSLLGYKYFFNSDAVSAQEIRRNVGENGIPLENFATYLNELVPSSIRRKGKLKSPKTTYRLTVFGEAKTKELIKRLAKT
ncbi:MAG: hypothetical protein Q8N88_04595 [Nanoarchaeota archaeon]|nr:hypothetical protein [Nanoarchaeota archaeon]